MIKHLNICLCLLAVVFWLHFDGSEAKPASALDSLDDDYYKLIGEPLPSGYYFVDKGYISSVQKKANRRKDGGAAGTVQFVPLIRYKQTKTKRKKLFVPNLFG